MFKFLKRLFCKHKFIAIAKGKQLDIIAELYGIKRNRHHLIFRETDKNFRKRIVAIIKSCK